MIIKVGSNSSPKASYYFFFYNKIDKLICNLWLYLILIEQFVQGDKIYLCGLWITLFTVFEVYVCFLRFKATWELILHLSFYITVAAFIISGRDTWWLKSHTQKNPKLNQLFKLAVSKKIPAWTWWDDVSEEQSIRIKSNCSPVCRSTAGIACVAKRKNMQFEAQFFSHNEALIEDKVSF